MQHHSITHPTINGRPNSRGYPTKEEEVTTISLELFIFLALVFFSLDFFSKAKVRVNLNLSFINSTKRVTSNIKDQIQGSFYFIFFMARY